ncbi:MAG: class I SAM-dependent methyltransferase [Sporichthyaceae bacterium]
MGRERVAAEPTVAANRAWWDAQAAEYQAEHGAFLGDADFVWGPEGLREADARLLGAVAGRDVLEFGAGAAQCSRWLAGAGARVVATDLSERQVRHSLALDARCRTRVPVAVADACALPFRAGSFDVVCSAYGALPFVADVGAVFREVARVLRPGGRLAFSVTHPFRWCFPDDPGELGLTVHESYFDRRAYVEYDADDRPSYVEHHRTIGDWVRELVEAGFTVADVVEPEWPAGHEQAWGGWSPLRGRLFPGTAIFLAHRA